MADEIIADLGSMDLPHSKQAGYKNMEYGVLRITLREGNRFTTIDLDPISAAAFGTKLIDWTKDTTVKTES